MIYFEVNNYCLKKLPIVHDLQTDGGMIIIKCYVSAISRYIISMNILRCPSTSFAA